MSRVMQRSGSGQEAESPTVRHNTIWARRFTAIVRIAFGVIWAIDAWFKWQPGFRNQFVSMVTGGAAGQPTWLKWWFQLWGSIFSTSPTFFAYVVAVGETLLAVALILGFARASVYIFGFFWSLMIWMTAEGFGRTPSGPATDIGTSIIYALVFLALLALDAYGQTRHYSLDQPLERQVPWWRKLAEVGARRAG